MFIWTFFPVSTSQDFSFSRSDEIFDYDALKQIFIDSLNNKENPSKSLYSFQRHYLSILRVFSSYDIYLEDDKRKPTARNRDIHVTPFIISNCYNFFSFQL